MEGKDELGVEKALFSVGLSAPGIREGEADMAARVVSKLGLCDGKRGHELCIQGRERGECMVKLSGRIQERVQVTVVGEPSWSLAACSHRRKQAGRRAQSVGAGAESARRACRTHLIASSVEQHGGWW